MKNVGIIGAEGLLEVNFSECKDIKDFIDSFEKSIESIGFSHFSFMLLSSHNLKQYGNFEEEVIDYYFRDKFFLKDQMVEHFQNNDDIMYTHRVKEHLMATPYMDRLTARRLAWITVLEKHRYRSIIFIPINLPSNERCLLWLSKKKASPDEIKAIFTVKMNSLNALVLTSINFLSVKFPEFLTIRSHSVRKLLKTKPLRLINEMAANDLQLKSAAEKLCISLDTANKHMSSAKSQLKAHTPMGALYRAIREGIVDPFDGVVIDSTFKEKKVSA